MIKAQSDLSWARLVVAIIGLLLYTGAIWATTSSNIAKLEAECAGQKELWEAQYNSLKESILRVETKVDRLLERDRVADIGGKDGN